MATTWADIQRLAAELQLVQGSAAEKKLTEANCVEVIQILRDRRDLEVIISASGKEYVTPRHLRTEVKNECLANGGRIELTALVPILNVGVEHIENAAANIVNQSDEFIQCAGEILSRDYINEICQSLNEKLQEVGHLSVLTLAKNFDLPTDLLNHYILTQLGTRIVACRIEDNLYTTYFVELQKNKLRAALAALTKPTSLSTIFSFFNISNSLFWNIWNGLAEANKLNGYVVGAKNSLKATYVPRMHDLLVRSYVKKTFESNGFIETSLLKKLSISDIRSYFAELFSKSALQKCVFLESVVSNVELVNEAVAAANEALKATLYAVIDDLLPTQLANISHADIEYIAQTVRKQNSNLKVVLSDAVVVYDSKLLGEVVSKLTPFIVGKAKTDAPTLVSRVKEERAKSQKSQKDVKKQEKAEDEDWNTGKKKGKGAKKPAGKGKAAPKEEKPADDLENIFALDKSAFNDELEKSAALPEQLLDELRDDLFSQADRKYREEVELALRTVESAETKDLKRVLEERKRKAQGLFEQFVMFRDGIESLSETLHNDLTQYLLKSIGNEICQLILSTFTDCPPNAAISLKVRDEFLASISEQPVRESVTKLFDGLKDVDGFLEAAKDLQARCGVVLRVPDKKQRSELLQEYESSLREKMSADVDAPSCLLLIILILYAAKRRVPVHASGKFVASLIRELAADESVPSSTIERLQEAQKLVVDSLKKKAADPELAATIQQKLADLKALVNKQ